MDPLEAISRFLVGGEVSVVNYSPRQARVPAGEPGGGQFASQATAAASRVTKSANRKGPSEKASLLADKAAEASKQGDHTLAAKYHRQAASAHKAMLEPLADGDRSKNGFFEHKDAFYEHQKAAAAHQKALGETPGKVLGGVFHVDERERAISHSLHDDRTGLSLKQTQSLLEKVGLRGVYHHEFGAQDLGGRRNGHTPSNSVAINKSAKNVRDALLGAGWTHTHVHNVPSISGGKNHQEGFKKGNYVLTTVDFGYGATTIRASKK